jgi:hypothetical protein
MDESSAHAESVVEHWDAVVGDMEATAAEYREDGWDVLELHPGDVTPVDADGPDDRWGFDVLVPDDEFAAVERRVGEADAAFDACEVLHATGDGVVFLVVAMLDREREAAVVFPAYYAPEEAADVFRTARREGEMRTHLRTLEPDAVVTFTQSDPSLFIPE